MIEGVLTDIMQSVMFIHVIRTFLKKQFHKRLQNNCYGIMHYYKVKRERLENVEETEKEDAITKSNSEG